MWVEPCHVLKALLDLDRNSVIERVGDIENAVDLALQQTSSTALKPGGPSSELESVLAGVSSRAGLWERLPDLVGYLPTPSHGAPTVGGPPTSCSQDAQRSDGVTVQTARTPSDILDAQLLSEVAEATKTSTAEVGRIVGSDLAYVCHLVAPETLDALTQSLDSILVVAADDAEAPFAIVADLSSRRHATGLARRLALAYVGVAFFCASVDTTVTEEEVVAIDQLRLELRSALSDESLAVSSTDEIFEQHFGDLVGLAEVKTELRHRLDYFLIGSLRRQRGMPVEDQSLHMAFLGNPGTGKTHVARRFAAALKDLNVLSSGHLVEVDRSGLVGQFVGHTEKKVSDVVDSAVGGVLFIDEAYALSDGSLNGGFGDEAIDVLVKRLEDDRSRLLAIFAGYSDRMDEFLGRNPGLRSRIPGVVHFPDYGLDQLIEVAESMASSSGYRFTPEARDKMRSNLEVMRGQPEFGNARTVRNLLEKSIRQQIARLAPLGDLATDDEQRLITATDVPDREAAPTQRVVGFQRILRN